MKKSKNKLIRYLKSGTAFFLLLFLIGCASQENTSGPDGSVTFTSDNPNPGNNSVVLTPQSAGGSSLTLDVRTLEVQDVFSASFSLVYPYDIIRFVSYTPGDFLSRGGAPVNISVNENPAGNLVVLVTRVGSVAGVSGSGNLLSLTFDAVLPGSNRMIFRLPALTDSQGNIIPGVSFVGGTVTVTQ